MTALVTSYIQHFPYLGPLLVLMLCGMGLPVPEDVGIGRWRLSCASRRHTPGRYVRRLTRGCDRGR